MRVVPGSPVTSADAMSLCQSPFGSVLEMLADRIEHPSQRLRQSYEQRRAGYSINGCQGRSCQPAAWRCLRVAWGGDLITRDDIDAGSGIGSRGVAVVVVVVVRWGCFSSQRAFGL